MLLPGISKPTFRQWCGRMLVKDRPIALRYAMAVFMVGIALCSASLLPWRADPSHFTLFFIAVMLSAWYGGFGTALVATIFSAVALDYYFIAPFYSIELDWRAFLRLAVFLSVASVTSYLTSARKRAEENLRRAHAELEDRVRERTAELAKTNDALRAEIAERARVENDLLRLQLEMGRVERLATLGRMAGTIAHDLGTPLNSVLGYTQLLSQESLSERARRRLAIIETQINRMCEIIQRYLSQTRGSPSKNKVAVKDLIRDTLVMLQPVFHQRRVEVTTRLAPEIPILYGDANSIQRVLINLLDNAVDACKEDGKIDIQVFETPATANNSRAVTIEITDAGVGIPAELMPRIFDLFVTTKPSGKGTGLGLVVCQEIVNAHGGVINIKSEVGQGTTVTVKLPVEANGEAAPATEETNERAYTDRR